MSIFKRLADVGREILGGRSLFRAGFSYVERMRGKFEQPDRTGEPRIEKYRGDVYACARMNATQVVQIPWRVYVESSRGKKQCLYRSRPVSEIQRKRLRLFSSAWVKKDRGGNQEFEEIEDHPLAVMLREVNPFENAARLMEGLVIYLEILGEAYWYVARDRSGIPREIWPLISQYVTPIPSEEKLIGGYLYGRDQESRISLAVEDVIQFRYFNPRSMYRGMGKLEAAIVQADTQASMWDYQRTLAANNAVGEWAIKSKHRINETDKARILRQIYEGHRGTWNAGNLLFLDGGDIELQQLAITPREMGYLQGIKATTETIARIFGVPMELLENKTGTLGSTGLQGANANYLRNTIRPILDMIAEQVNQDLVPLFDPTRRLFLAFDNPIPQDHEFRRMMIQTAPSAFRKNEVRDLAGLPPLDDAEDGFLQPQGVTGGGAFGLSRSDMEKKHVSCSCGFHAVRKREGFDEPGSSDPVRGFIRALRDYFSQQEKEVMDRLYRVEKTVATKSIADLMGGDILDTEFWREEFSATMEPFITRAMFDGVQYGRDHYGVSITWESDSPEVREAVGKFGEHLAGAVNRETQANIRASMERVLRSLPEIEAGLKPNDPKSIQEISLAIAEEFQKARDSRTDRIARTETLRARNSGTIEVLAAADITEWEWSATENACPFCAALNGRKFRVGSNAFSIGDVLRVRVGSDVDGEDVQDLELKVEFSDVQAPPLHPHCLCVPIPSGEI